MVRLQDVYEAIENQIDYHFKNPDLLYQAFTRSTYASENGGYDNEELEFIGDKVLDLIVIKIFTERYGYMVDEEEDYDAKNQWNEFYFDGQNEGSLTDLKAKLVCKKNLSERITALGFHHFLFMGTSDISNQVENEDSAKEDLFEAILGAVALDSKWNIESMQNVVEAMLDFDYCINNEEDDFVSLLQSWNCKVYGEIPMYFFKKTEEGYVAHVSIHTKRGILDYFGEGYNKAAAKRECAKNSYLDLDAHDELWTIYDELPNRIDENNAVDILFDLAQKGYQDYPIYEMTNYIDGKGREKWKCICIIKDKCISKSSKSSIEEMAKKKASYAVLKKEFDLQEEDE